MTSIIVTPAKEPVKKSTIGVINPVRPFETTAPRSPQGEEFFLMPSRNYLMLRSAPLRDAACGGSSGQGARLEARIMPMQPSVAATLQFLHTRFRGNDGDKAGWA